MSAANGYDIRLEGGKYRVTCNGVFIRSFSRQAAAIAYVKAARDYDQKLIAVLRGINPAYIAEDNA